MSTVDGLNVTGAVVKLLEFNYTMHTHVLRDIHPLLTLNATKMITHSVVSWRLDYSNALLHGTSATNLNKLQVVAFHPSRV